MLLTGCGRVGLGTGSAEEPARTTRLIVTPASAQAGVTVGISVLNAGEVTLFYGLDNRIERRSNGTWEDATEDVFGTANPPVLLIRLIAKPGELAGPRHNAVTDSIRLPRSLPPGDYRIVKEVTVDVLDRAPRSTLHAELEVRPAAPQNG
jgi:hypothetical protein